MNLSVRITPEAEAQIREINNWWRRHRNAAPDLFVDELAAHSKSSAMHLKLAGGIDLRLYQGRGASCSKRPAIMFTTWQVLTTCEYSHYGMRDGALDHHFARSADPHRSRVFQKGCLQKHALEISRPLNIMR